MAKVAQPLVHTYVISPGIRPGCRTVLSNVVANSSQLQLEGSEAVPRTQTSDTQHDGELVKGDKQDTCKACQAGRRYASTRKRLVLKDSAGPTDYISWPDRVVIFGYVTPDLGLCIGTGH